MYVCVSVEVLVLSEGSWRTSGPMLICLVKEQFEEGEAERDRVFKGLVCRRFYGPKLVDVMLCMCVAGRKKGLAPNKMEREMSGRGRCHAVHVCSWEEGGFIAEQDGEDNVWKRTTPPPSLSHKGLRSQKVADL